MNFFRQNFISRKTPSVILVVAMVFVSGSYLFIPRKAHALLGVGDVGITYDPAQYGLQATKWSWERVEQNYSNTMLTAGTAAETAQGAIAIEEKAEHWADLAMQIIIETALRSLMAMLTNDIINWIQNGYDGKPAFMSANFGSYISDAVDDAGGAFVDQYLGAGWLCNEFDLAIRIPLLDEHPYEERARCTLSAMGANIGKFAEDFTSYGGWAEWIQLTSPQNHFYGAYIKAQAEKEKVEQEAKEEAEKDALMGNGFLSINKCTWRDASGVEVKSADGVRGKLPLPEECMPGKAESAGFTRPCNQVCETQTPASAVSNIANKSLTAGMDRVNNTLAALAAKGGSFFKPYIMAIGEALINQLIKDGLAELRGLAESESATGDRKVTLPEGITLQPISNLPADTDEELIPVLTLLQDLKTANKSLKQLLSNQQKARQAVDDLRMSDGMVTLLNRDTGGGTNPYKPVEFLRQFNYLNPVLSKAREWYDICRPCQHGRACVKFDRRKTDLLNYFTAPFSDSFGRTVQRILFEEYDKETTLISTSTDETMYNPGAYIEVTRTTVTTNEKEDADYAFNVYDLIDAGYFYVKTAIKTVDISEKTRQRVEGEHGLFKWETTYQSSSNTQYSPETTYSWIDWYIDINDQSEPPRNIDVLTTYPAQEVIDYSTEVFTDFVNQFEASESAKTKELITKVSSAINVLEDEEDGYIPATKKYLKLYKRNLDLYKKEDYNTYLGSPECLSDSDCLEVFNAKQDMEAKKPLAMEAVKDIDHFGPDTFEYLSPEVKKLTDGIIEKDSKLTQLLGDDEYPGKKSLYGLVEVINELGPNMSELYFKCKTGITPLNNNVAPFRDIW